MQFSTIISVAAFIVAVAAAPVCEAPATQTSTINCGNTPGYPNASCVITNGSERKFIPFEGSICSVVQNVHIATAMCCSTQQQGLVNVALPCINAL